MKWNEIREKDKPGKDYFPKDTYIESMKFNKVKCNKCKQYVDKSYTRIKKYSKKSVRICADCEN